MEKTTPKTKLLKEGSTHQSSFTKRIWKNLLVLSSAFLLNFTAFRGLQNLQSTLNSEAGLGVVSLSCVYASMVLSCMYAPFFIHKVGSCKWTIVVCFFGHVLYTGSNFYPSWYTLMPSSVLLGAISGPLWTAQNTYLTSSAQEYAEQHESPEGDIAKFNGIFYLLNDLSGIIGNLISSLVFSARTQDIGKGEFCGAMDCGIRPEANYSSHYVTNSSAPYKLAGFPADDKEHAVVANAVLLIYMLLWQPDEDSLGMILAVSGGWAVVRTVWRIQLFAVLGTMFPSNQEAVFANTKMAESIGSMLVFAYSAALCMDVKLYIYMAVLALGTVGFGVFECKTRNKKNQEADTS
ncbi:protein unc-93 homolog A-like [Branchiostoma floridae x Branchiostoma japonicum]